MGGFADALYSLWEIVLVSEIEKRLNASELIASYDHTDLSDDDGYYTVHLYRDVNNQYFRYVEVSGMNSPFSGAQGFIEPIGVSYDDSWKDA